MSKEDLNSLLFSYTAEQWARIAAELPERGCHKEIRMYLEAYIFGQRFAEFKDQNDPYPDIKDHENLAKAARALIIAYQPLLAIGDLQRATREQLIEEISKLAEMQEDKARDLKERRKEQTSRGRKPPFKRDQLLYYFVAVWAQLGRQVRSSVKPLPGRAEKSKADGPLVRFLMSAANPVLPKPLTEGAARAFIRKIKDGKSRPPWSHWDFSAAIDDRDASMV